MCVCLKGHFNGGGYSGNGEDGALESNEMYMSNIDVYKQLLLTFFFLLSTDALAWINILN